MVTEDYVSFETAKLLKEKGFDGECKMKYREHDKKMLNHVPNPGGLDYTTNADAVQKHSEENHCEYCLCPTLQMAMKWLRNIHDIVCSVGLFTDLPEIPPYWSFNILNQSTANVMYEAFDAKCETYEEAAESAIKYCLQNLI